MQITDLLAQMGGIQSVAKELGVSESDALKGAETLLPAILGGMKKQAQSQSSDLGGLGGLLGQLGGSGLLDQVLGSQPTDASQGNNILGQIFGSKDVSRTVAQDAAARSGLDPTLLKQMLPMLAMLVTGFMSKQGATSAPPQSGGLGGLLGGMLGGNRQESSSLLSMLDLNGDGNPLDDILRLAGKSRS